MGQSVHIKVDYDKCVGSRICMAIAPKVFQLNQDGQATVANPQGDTLDIIQMAAEACPVSAIVVEAADDTKSAS